MSRWRRFGNLTGQTVREIGVLMFVFVPLEAAFSEPIDPTVLAGLILLSLLLIGCGILVEVTL